MPQGTFLELWLGSFKVVNISPVTLIVCSFVEVFVFLVFVIVLKSLAQKFYFSPRDILVCLTLSIPLERSGKKMKVCKIIKSNVPLTIALPRKFRELSEIILRNLIETYCVNRVYALFVSCFDSLNTHIHTKVYLYFIKVNNYLFVPCLLTPSTSHLASRLPFARFMGCHRPF